MATNLDYQKARRIRNTSFADLLSDQLSGDSTIRGAIGKTISLRAQAKVKGFKEKFDPLNIAKFLTGGSSLGPALLGKLTGRSEKDIQYFSGRMRPVRDRGTASRIGREPGMGKNEGVNEMLRKIYYLMQITRESDLERSDRELNFAEEKKLEAEKRHKELLKALSGKVVETATKVSERGFSLADLFGSASLAARLLSVLRWFGSPVGLALLGVASMAALIALLAVGLDILAKNTPNMKALSPEEARNILQNGSPKDIESFGGREALEDVIKNGRKRAEEVLAMPEDTEEQKKAKRLSILEMGGEDKVKKIVADTTAYEVPPPAAQGAGMADKLPFTKKEYIGTGTAAKLKEDTWNKNFAPYYNDDGTKKVSKIAPVGGSTTPPAVAPQLSPAPAPVSGTDLTMRLGSVTDENINSNLPQGKPAVAPSVVNNVNTGQTRQMPQKTAELNTIPVRNMDPTFMRLIMDNTRVV